MDVWRCTTDKIGFLSQLMDLACMMLTWPVGSWDICIPQDMQKLELLGVPFTFIQSRFSNKLFTVYVNNWCFFIVSSSSYHDFFFF